jgi:uncharacterized membrane protein YkvA (DUF1232 family)
LSRAAHYLKNPDRLRDLISRATSKAESTGSGGPLSGAWTALKEFLELLMAYARGSYRQASWQTLVIIVAAILYFLMPIDVMPDVIPGVGYIDDVAVFAWVVNVVGSELEKFRAWKQARAGAADERPADPLTLPAGPPSASG